MTTWFGPVISGSFLGVSAIMLCSGVHGAAEKLVDTILFPSNAQTFRWSEASTINLDGENHLLMAVTLFGAGGHDNTEAQILEFHSYDGGLTWTDLEDAAVLQKNVGEENTMSPALLKLSNGDILCFVNVKNSRRDSGPWWKRSSDGGRTWGELQRLPYEGYGGVGCDRAIQVQSGRILLPCWFSTDELASTRVTVFYSDDLGHTWKTSPVISTPKGTTGRRTDPAAEEPMILERQDGSLLMIMRCYLKSIYQCESTDGGATWSQPVRCGKDSRHDGPAQRGRAPERSPCGHAGEFRQGISRSAAVAVVIACRKGMTAADAFDEHIFQTHHRPNTLVLSLGRDILGRPDIIDEYLRRFKYPRDRT